MRKTAPLLTLLLAGLISGCYHSSDAEASKDLPIEIREEHPVDAPGAGGVKAEDVGEAIEKAE